MKRILAGLGLSVAALLVVVFVGDYLVLRYRIAANRNAFGTVAVSSYYAVQEKNNKTEYVFKDLENQDCVHSLFPHSGCAPCWYMNRHPEKQIPI